MKYDYIIAGAGCAGLSLLYSILKDPALQNKKTLLLDKSKKADNDRTWCYWEKGEGIFEPIVHHQWRTLEFLTQDFTRRFDLEKYSYKMIRGIDFYQHILGYASQFENVSFRYENILTIETEGDQAQVETDQAKYSATYVFNSTGLFHPKITTENSLLQHFKGWVIKTETPQFNPKIGTLMDFRLDQKQGITFMYVLPTSSTEALVEYTLFTERVLEKEEYELELEQYIKDFLNIENYEIIHKEFGVIPMSLAKFPRHAGSGKRIINMGTAGGFTKSSSGYTFQFIQKNTQSIVRQLRENLFPDQKLTLQDRKFQWYDRTLLEVILSKSMEGKQIFSRMFKKLPPESILAFLGNESSLLEEIKIMNSLPVKPFLKAGLKQLK